MDVEGPNLREPIWVWRDKAPRGIASQPWLRHNANKTMSVTTGVHCKKYGQTRLAVEGVVYVSSQRFVCGGLLELSLATVRFIRL